MPTLDLAQAVQALPPPWQGRYFDVVGSTQAEARAASRLGAPSRSIFVADFQRVGRGRQGRAWIAAAGVALLVSALFRETSAATPPWRWTSLAAVALADAIADVAAGCSPGIKWPNDLMLGSQKVAGILAETISDGQSLVALVGIGVNVTSSAADLAGLGQATSLRLACGQDVDRGLLLLALVSRMDAWLARPWPELHAAWQSRLWGRGQHLRLVDLHGEADVVVLGAESDGSLRVRLADGTERLTTTGELIP